MRDRQSLGGTEHDRYTVELHWNWNPKKYDVDKTKLERKIRRPEEAIVHAGDNFEGDLISFTRTARKGYFESMRKCIV